MKLQDQVCTLEQGKRLKALGVKQVAEWHWRYDPAKATDSFMLAHKGTIPEKDSKYENPAAFSVAELGVMLPTDITAKSGFHWSFYHRHNWKGESVGYQTLGQPTIDQDWYKTEAEARAAMVIYLLEINVITAEEVNKRLEA